MVNLTITRGDTLVFTAAILQSGAAFNLTGCTVRMTAKWGFADADGAAVFARTSPSTGIYLGTPAAGIATVTLVPANTASLPAAIVILKWDLQVTDGSAHVYTVASGDLVVNPDVSVTTP